MKGKKGAEDVGMPLGFIISAILIGILIIFIIVWQTGLYDNIKQIINIYV